MTYDYSVDHRVLKAVGSLISTEHLSLYDDQVGGIEIVYGRDDYRITLFDEDGDSLIVLGADLKRVRASIADWFRAADRVAVFA